MRKRLIILALLAALMLCLLPGCNDDGDVITPEKAQQLALEHAGLKASEVDDVHTHLLTDSKIPSFSIHITVGDVEYEYVISANGEILSSTSYEADGHTH